MTKIIKKMESPSLGVNAKSYMWGKPLFEIAKRCEEIATTYDLTVTMNVPFVDIRTIRKIAPHIFINAEYADDISAGSAMGGIVPEALKDAGADGVVINHAGATKKYTLSQIISVVDRCKKAGLLTHVCVDSVEEARMMAQLHPTSLIVEQSKLIGTGILADENYIRETTAAIHEIDPNVIVSQGAGIKCGADIYRNISLGSSGGGGASGIFCSEDPIATINEYVENGILKARKDFGTHLYFTVESEVEDD